MRQLAFVAVPLLLALTACAEESPTTPSATPSPTDPHFTWTDDGVRFSAANNGMVAIHDVGDITIVGDTCGGAAVEVTFPDTGGASLTFTVWDDTGPLLNYRDSDGEEWVTDPWLGGAITLSRVSQDGVGGDFSYTVVPVGMDDGRGTVQKFLKGTFDLVIEDKSVS